MGDKRRLMRLCDWEFASPRGQLKRIQPLLNAAEGLAKERAAKKAGARRPSRRAT